MSTRGMDEAEAIERCGLAGRLARGAGLLAEDLLDVILPRHCAVCGRKLEERGRRVVCGECERGMERIGEEHCAKCGRPGRAAVGGLCSTCVQDEPRFDAARARLVYEAPASRLICTFKYNCMVQVGDCLAGLLAAGWALLPDEFRAADVLVPVPLHPLRWVERGFNQAEILARAVSRTSKVPVASGCLYRVKDTERQVGLSAEARRRNMAGAFEVLAPEKVRGRTVVLIDDVITTGSTLNACARELKRRGAKRVYAYTVAAAGTGGL